MAQLFNDVQPGDLITADLMNKIMQEVQSLEDRVTTLENTTPADTSVVIDSLFPSSTVRVGGTLRVRGRNFQYTIGSARASVAVGTDVREISVFNAGSTDQELIVQIPVFPNVPLAGVAASLTVRNQTTSAQAALTLLPTQTSVSGAVDVTAGAVSPTSFVAGDQNIDFAYTISSRANLPAGFTIDPELSVPSNQAAWQSALQVLNADKTVNSSKTIPLNAGEQKTFYVRLTQVPASPANATFSLTVTATSQTGAVNPGSAGPSSYTVGQQVVVPDSAIVTLSVQLAEFDPSTGGSLDTTSSEDTLTVKAAALSVVTLLVEFNAVDDYAISVSKISGAQNWDVHVDGQASFHVTSADLNNPQLKTQRNPQIVVQPLQGASSSGEIEFSVSRQNHNPRARRMLLVLG